MAEETKPAQVIPLIDAETVRRVNESIARACREATEAFAQMTRTIQLNRIAWLAFDEVTAGKLPAALDQLDVAALDQLLEGARRLDMAVREAYGRRP